MVGNNSALALPTPARLWSKGNGRIIGGSSANIANYPWQLSFQYGGSHICGASIISSNWALTAAHCVDGMSLSDQFPGRHLNAWKRRFRQKRQLWLHARIMSGSLLGSSAQAVGLASDNYDPPGGLGVTVTGWGATYTDGPSANSLLKVDISILDRNTCKNTFANINTVTDRMVCAGQADRSVCSGDSGGPLVSGSTQVGIVSWGSSSCEATPGVFSNVGAILGWYNCIYRLATHHITVAFPTMLRLVLWFTYMLGSAVALPAPARLWSRGSSRVIGGSDADIANYPWQLAFEFSGSLHCGASIISSNWVLTAAHCVEAYSLPLMSFRAGSSTRESGGTVLQASSGYMHGSFNARTLDYDIAVVQVSGSLLGDNTQAVELASDGYDPPAGLAVTVTGWGLTVTGGQAPSNLQKVDISILDRSTCRDLFASMNTVTERMVCAGEAGHTVCSGDSGGPLVSGSTQVGVVSWGYPDECEATPGVYTSVGNLRSWVRALTGV
ncbi:transmembrane protease serine 9-like [Schistocerca nitens]|uniref:transmembrane protease serine 9-like n=1 Tax=Schistocerca nitens TaxID=7011 RepID=UPI00211978D5|nr:transmembrane protease serine 9-like [Schistocerca nitens]